MKKIVSAILVFISVVNIGPGMKVFAADVPAIEEGKGLVVFYRPSKAKGGGIRFNMRGSNGLQHSLLNGTYLVEQLEPGEYTYTVSSPSVDATDAIVISVKAAEVYFVRGDLAVGWPAWRTKFAVVSEETGRAEFSKMK
jgi:hypothetical protein